MSPFQPDERQLLRQIKIEADRNDPFRPSCESQPSSGEDSMDVHAGRTTGRAQPIPSEHITTRHNASVRRRALTTNEIKGKGLWHDETRSETAKFDESSPSENQTELQNHTKGAEFGLPSPFEADQHNVPHAGNDRENAQAASDEHMSVQALVSRLQTLREQDVKLQQDQARLKAQVKDSEAACGRMIQQYIEIAQAIGVRQQHIQEDKTNLQRVQQSRDRVEAEVATIMGRISSTINLGGVGRGE